MSQTVDLQIGMDEHVFVCGMTGSGKTILSDSYLANVPSMVIKLDTKGEVFLKQKNNEPIWYGLHDKDVDIIQNLKDLPNCTKNRIIYVPVTEEMTQEYYNSLGNWIYDKGDCIFFIDELMSVADSALKYPMSLKKLYTRGRFKNAVCWACTQRPMDIPTICIANSQRFFAYTMPQPQDKKKLVDCTGCQEFKKKLHQFYFYYYKMGDEHAIEATLKL